MSFLTANSAPSTRTVNDYAELKRRIKAAGLLDPQPLYYWTKTAIAAATVALAVVMALRAGSWWMLALDGVFMGFAFTQVALLAHDVGHRQGYRGRTTNAIAKYVFGNVLLGVSPSWWNEKHNQHHATPNHIDKDPDIQFPMLVFAPEQAANRPAFLRPLLRIQAFVLLALIPFQAVNMRVQSLGHLRRGTASKPALQVCLLTLHFVAYGALLVALGWPGGLIFAVAHHAVFGVYNSSVFASNHKGMPLTQDGARLDFFREQVLTSRNIRGRRLTDFWYGGLNYQIEHHLFPTMPRNNLEKAQPIVRDYCAEVGIAYHSTGLLEAYREVFRELRDVGAAVGRRPAIAA